jgi:hypothetical protein
MKAEQVTKAALNAQSSSHTTAMGQIGQELHEFKAEQRILLEKIVSRTNNNGLVC